MQSAEKLSRQGLQRLAQRLHKSVQVLRTNFFEQKRAFTFAKKSGKNEVLRTG